MINCFFQRIPRAKIQVILRNHIPRIRDHLIDQILVEKILLSGAHFIQNGLKPEQLIAFRLVVKESGQRCNIQLVRIRKLHLSLLTFTRLD